VILVNATPEPRIAHCCAVCVYSPFKGKKSKIELCKKVKEFVSIFMICNEFAPDNNRINKRIGGFKSSLNQKMSKIDLKEVF